ncbi:MAG: Fic family protein [Methanosarcina sp.]|uniref:Fic family protein n=1 Tax=Methanosarcina sp. TaxID=2213 RepID=UPI0026327A0F|nr:Fic family protein [Methanosarcina sp.]MDD3248317.1 Fic family protein [Methanosarcina sp.]
MPAEGNEEHLSKVGYAYLVELYGLEVFPHHYKSYISEKGPKRTAERGGTVWNIFPEGYFPGESTGEQLEFALKYEGINLQLLAFLFEKINPGEICEFVKKKPTGKYTRKIWFLYEFLTGEKLFLEDLKAVRYVDLLEEDAYYTADRVPSKRHRVYNNLSGGKEFCPLVRKSSLLKTFEAEHLDRRCEALLKEYPETMIRRALSYFYTKETKSSFDIEHATPDQKRSFRFIELLKLAGQREFCKKDSLIELQKAVIDPRFAGNDYRMTQNYVGESIGRHQEIVHFVPPSPGDLPDLMEGLVKACKRMLSSEIHPVVSAAVISFGFVFLHPFEDGNGRVHRFLIHHVLEKTGFTPKGLIFPVSASMMKNLDRYDETLELFSKPLLRFVEYTLDGEKRITAQGNHANYYRYIDMTPFAEYLFTTISDTIDSEMEAEFEYLRNYDRARSIIREIVDMPDRLLDLFITVSLQNRGKLSGKKHKSMFSMLTDDEVEKMETCIEEIFGYGKA